MARSHISQLYRPSLAMLLDFYHLTMAYGFWKSGQYNRRAAFNLFYRKNPFGHPFTIACGLQLAVDILENFRFEHQDIQYLGRIRDAGGKPMFDIPFLNYLQRLKFSCNVDAVPEGTMAQPLAPLLRVEGPLIEAQIVEAALLNVINFSTLVATKAARMYQAAGGEIIIEFGLRRAQSIDGSVTATRAAYIGGCHGTSNVLAGRLYDIPVMGTHAHSWVMVFADEITSFREFARALPGNSIFLVDTYDTTEGIRNAIRVGRELREAGHEMAGIRLDSGDLTELSIRARNMLDEAGFPQADIVGSDQIDEYGIAEHKTQGGRINVWGIGTRLVTAYDQPALGGVYKLTAVTAPEDRSRWQYKIKLSEESAKVTTPGLHRVQRLYNSANIPVADMIYDENLPYSRRMYPLDGKPPVDLSDYDARDLMVPVFRDGRLVYDSPDVHAIRSFSLRQQQLAASVDWPRYQVGLEKHLHLKKVELIEEYRRVETE